MIINWYAGTWWLHLSFETTCFAYGTCSLLCESCLTANRQPLFLALSGKQHPKHPWS